MAMGIGRESVVGNGHKDKGYSAAAAAGDRTTKDSRSPGRRTTLMTDWGAVLPFSLQGPGQPSL